MSEEYERPNTRSRAQAAPGLLNIPSAETYGRRSPIRSPTHVDNIVANLFSYEPAASNMADIDALREQLRAEIRAEFRNETAAAAARDPDAIKRRLELPPFDKSNIDIWIK